MTEFENRLKAQEKAFAAQGRQRLVDADAYLRIEVREKPVYHVLRAGLAFWGAILFSLSIWALLWILSWEGYRWLKK